jgi:hypothetical protein
MLALLSFSLPLVGLYQFLFKFIPRSGGKTNVIRLGNLLSSIPNDDDIERVYKWERKTHQENLAASKHERIKLAKLSLVAKCLWSGPVALKTASGSGQWEDAYLVLQERRLVWWRKESDIDEGKPFEGQLLLYGHAGVCSASPLDLKEMRDASRLTSVFGSQQKCSIFCKNATACQELVALIGSITT